MLGALLWVSIASAFTLQHRIPLPVLLTNRGEAIATSPRGDIAVLVAAPLRLFIVERGGEKVIEVELPGEVIAGDGKDLVSDQGLGFLLSSANPPALLSLHKEGGGWRLTSLSLTAPIEPLSAVRRKDNALILFHRSEGSLWIRTPSGTMFPLNLTHPNWSHWDWGRLEPGEEGEVLYLGGDKGVWRIDLAAKRVTAAPQLRASRGLTMSTQGLWSGENPLVLRDKNSLRLLETFPDDTLRNWGLFPLADIASLPPSSGEGERLALLPLSGKELVIVTLDR